MKRIAIAIFVALLVGTCALFGNPRALWAQGTPNLDCPHWATGEIRPEFTVNDATNCLDNAGQSTSALTFFATDDDDQTMTDAQWRGGAWLVISSTASLTEPRNLEVPAIQRELVIENATNGGQAIVITTNIAGSPRTVSIPNGSALLIKNDGTNVDSIGVDIGGLPVAGSANPDADTLIILQGSALRQVVPNNLGITGGGGSSGGAGAGLTQDFKLIAEVSASSQATVTLDFDPTQYSEVLVTVGYLVSAADDREVWLRFRQSGVTQSGGTAYRWKLIGGPDGVAGGDRHDESSGDSTIRLTRTDAATAALGNASGESLSGWFHVVEPNNSGAHKRLFGLLNYAQASGDTTGYLASATFVDDTDAIDGFEFALEGGTNIVSGEFKLWGRPATLQPGQMPVASRLFHVRDEKATTVEGGTSSAGSNTRTLNTVVRDDGNGCSLSSNQVTCPAGDYVVVAWAPAVQANRHKVLWYNTTDSAVEIVGRTAYTNSADSVQTDAGLFGKISLAAQKTFELRHDIEIGSASTGLGIATDDGTVEIYADVQVWRIDEGLSGAEPDWEVIEEQTASASSEITFAGFNPALYDELQVRVLGFVPASDNAHLRLQVSDDGGATYESASYEWSRIFQDASAVSPSYGGSTSASEGLTSAIRLTSGVGTNGGENASLTITLDNASSSTLYKTVTATAGVINGGTDHILSEASGSWQGGLSAVDGLRFFASSGNIEAGKFILRGRRKSPQVGQLSPGHWREVARKSVSGVASIDFLATDFNADLYDQWRITLRDIDPATNAVDLWLRVSTDGSACLSTAVYDYYVARHRLTDTGSSAVLDEDTDTKIVLFDAMSSTAGQVGDMIIQVPHPGSANDVLFDGAGAARLNGGDRWEFKSTGYFTGTPPIKGFCLQMSSGNISGEVILSVIDK